MNHRLDAPNSTVKHSELKSRYGVRMAVHDRLKRAMDHRNVKATQLASATGSSRATVSDWLTGKTGKISGDRLVKAALFLSVPPEYLLFGQNAPDWARDKFRTGETR